MKGPAIQATIGLDAEGVRKGADQATGYMRKGAKDIEAAGKQAAKGLKPVEKAAQETKVEQEGLRGSIAGTAAAMASGTNAADAFATGLAQVAAATKGGLGLGLLITGLAAAATFAFKAHAQAKQLSNEIDKLAKSAGGMGSANSSVDELATKLGEVTEKYRKAATESRKWWAATREQMGKPGQVSRDRDKMGIEMGHLQSQLVQGLKEEAALKQKAMDGDERGVALEQARAEWAKKRRDFGAMLEHVPKADAREIMRMLDAAKNADLSAINKIFDDRKLEEYRKAQEEVEAEALDSIKERIAAEQKVFDIKRRAAEEALSDEGKLGAIRKRLEQARIDTEGTDASAAMVRVAELEQEAKAVEKVIATRRRAEAEAAAAAKQARADHAAAKREADIDAEMMGAPEAAAQRAGARARKRAGKVVDARNRRGVGADELQRQATVRRDAAGRLGRSQLDRSAIAAGIGAGGGRASVETMQSSLTSILETLKAATTTQLVKK